MKRSMTAFSGLLVLLGACSVFEPSKGKAEANAVVRRYSRTSPEVWEALTSALKPLALRIESDRHDALGGDLTAIRATEDSVKINVKSLDEMSSQVSISVGEGDRNMA